MVEDCEPKMNYPELKKGICTEIESILTRYWSNAGQHGDDHERGGWRTGPDRDVSRRLRRLERQAALRFAASSDGLKLVRGSGGAYSSGTLHSNRPFIVK